MHKKASLIKSRVNNSVLTVLVYFFAAVVISPLILLFLTTFKDDAHIYDPFYIPDFTFFQNYVDVFEKSDITVAFLNTVIITALTLVFEIIIAAMAGYIISRSKERFFKVLYAIIVSVLIIPTSLNMIIVYKIGVFLHMMNTIPYLVLLYVAGSAAFSSLIYAAFTKGIPKEIEESAQIDGCGMYSTFFRIILRLLMPATGTVIAITMYWFWNDFQGPLIYLNDGRHPTLMFEIWSFKTNVGNTGFFSTNWGPTFAFCFLASLPIMIFFLFTQKYLLKGLVSGAVKG